MAAPGDRARNEAARLCCTVPRLDRPFRLWIVPADKLTWLAGGLAPAMLWLNFDWSAMVEPSWWGLTIVGGFLGAVGGSWQPERRHVARWFLAWLGFVCTPRRAVWRPGKG